MKEYRRKKKEETGVSQKQYVNKEVMKMKAKEKYHKNTALNDIKYLFF